MPERGTFGPKMMQAPSYLRNTRAVVEAFGYWPSFHDAAVVDIRYDPDGGGVVGLTLHGWEITREVDERGVAGGRELLPALDRPNADDAAFHETAGRPRVDPPMSAPPAA